MSLDAALRTHRERAAQASGGTSDDAIYACFLRQVRRLGLDGDLLDYGAGQGWLTSRLLAARRFASITAIDLTSRPSELEAAIDWWSSDLNDPAPFRAGSFTVVVAAEIIEHLENPRAVAREWFRLLRPGGTLLLSTPNNESWRSLATLMWRGHFVAFTDRCYPAHITALLRMDLRRILDEAGFAQIEFAFTDRGGVPKLPRLHWQAISAGRLRGLRFSDNLIAIARRR